MQALINIKENMEMFYSNWSYLMLDLSPIEAQMYLTPTNKRWWLIIENNEKQLSIASDFFLFLIIGKRNI